MTNNQLFFAMIGLQVAFFGLIYKYIDSKFDALNEKLKLEFERQELLLKLHEALHHKV